MTRRVPTATACALVSDCRGAISLWVGLAIPLFLVAGGVAINVSEGMLERQRVQMAADLGAQAGAAAYGRDENAERAANMAADVAELNGVSAAAGRSWNAASKTLTAGQATIAIGEGVTDPSRVAVSVTVAKPIDMAFAGLLGTATRTVTATGVAEAWNLPSGGGGGGPGSAGSGACVLAMRTSGAAAIKVDNMGRIQTSGCAIHANSTATGSATGGGWANAAITLNSGTLSGSAITSPGNTCLSNSGSNTVSPAVAGSGFRCTPTNTAAAQADPFAAMAEPSPSQPTGCAVNSSYGVCCIPPLATTVNGVSPTATNAVAKSYTGWQSSPRSFSPANGGVFCGNTTIGGNGTSDTFAPGIYYVVNGNLTFNNSNIISANGVTFVLIGRAGGNPGAISWTNYSNTYTLTAPSSGPTANIVFWQGCKADGTAPTNTMAGGSTLTMSGAFYARCGELNMTNNIQMNAASGASFKVVARNIYVAGSAGINAAGGSTPAAPSTPADVALVR